MATRYVGIGGNDGNSGLTWALRKLTLNGVEDTPVVAGDLVYVGPGVYRELLTVDVSGGAGTQIVYHADIFGEHTDGVGGLVRITGSDNDQTTARNYCVEANARTYRTFRGFCFDLVTSRLVYAIGSPTNWVLEDCAFSAATLRQVELVGDAQADCTIRRCFFARGKSGQYAMRFSSAGIQNVGHLIQNCLLDMGYGRGIEIDDVGGINIRNTGFLGSGYGIRISDALPGGYTAINVNNCIFEGCGVGMLAMNLGEIVENYNTFYGCATNRTNVAVGANSVAYPALLHPPMLHAGASQVSGFRMPWWYGMLSEWSQIKALTGSNEASEDLLGILRPVTASKNSWGPVQFHDAERDTGTVHGGSASIKLADAGRVQIKVPVTATSTTISVYVYREANYAGNLPQMIVKQPGQADDVTTDANAASQWNLLTTTLTPAASPSWVIVELVSRNTAVALNYDTFFDDLEVS